jgi:hypothetical protein
MLLLFRFLVSPACLLFFLVPPTCTTRLTTRVGSQWTQVVSPLFLSLLLLSILLHFSRIHYCSTYSSPLPTSYCTSPFYTTTTHTSPLPTSHCISPPYTTTTHTSPPLCISLHLSHLHHNYTHTAPPHSLTTPLLNNNRPVHSWETLFRKP